MTAQTAAGRIAELKHQRDAARTWATTLEAENALLWDLLASDRHMAHLARVLVTEAS